MVSVVSVVSGSLPARLLRLGLLQLVLKRSDLSLHRCGLRGT